MSKDHEFTITVRLYDDTDAEELARVISDHLQDVRSDCRLGSVGFIDVEYKPTEYHVHTS